MLGFFEQYRLWLLAAALAAAFTAGWAGNGWRMGEQLAQVQADQAKALATAQAQARTEEQRRQTALEIIRNDARQSTEQHLADTAAADATADGLRDELDRIKRRAARCAGVATGGAPAKDATTVLADVLGEMESAGRELAAEADRRGIAGRACEAAYGVLK